MQISCNTSANLLAFEIIYSRLFIPHHTRNHVITRTNKIYVQTLSVFQFQVQFENIFSHFMFIFISPFATDSWIRCSRLSSEAQLLGVAYIARSKRRRINIKLKLYSGFRNVYFVKCAGISLGKHRQTFHFHGFPGPRNPWKNSSKSWIFQYISE